MKDFVRTAKRATVTAAIGLTVAVATAGPAAAASGSAFGGTYPTPAKCAEAGHQLIQTGAAVSYTCTGSGRTWHLNYRPAP